MGAGAHCFQRKNIFSEEEDEEEPNLFFSVQTYRLF